MFCLQHWQVRWQKGGCLLHVIGANHPRVGEAARFVRDSPDETEHAQSKENIQSDRQLDALVMDEGVWRAEPLHEEVKRENRIAGGNDGKHEQHWQPSSA